MEPELVADTAVAVGGTLGATETGSASVADAMGTSGSSGPVGSIPICVTVSARTMYSATPAASGACGRTDTLDPLSLQGRVILSQQLVDRVILAEMRVG